MSISGGSSLQCDRAVSRHVGVSFRGPQVVYELLRHLVDKIENHANEIMRYKDIMLRMQRRCDFIRIIRPFCFALVADRRQRGDRIGLLELQTLWPFPSMLVRRSVREADT